MSYPQECWHQNVTACHETYVTEFRPNQEQVCEENFWKACKITFKEVGYNYTLKSCMKPLIKQCDEPVQDAYGPPAKGNYQLYAKIRRSFTSKIFP